MSKIPAEVLNDLLVRFINNLPPQEKGSYIRCMFQVEQAHWFYLDFYCTDDFPNNRKVGFREFTRIIFHNCGLFANFRKDIEEIIDEFRQYKSAVPTYGLVLLDQSLNYVLLVQGYFSNRKSWGFPKGKINEDEIPIQCAIREVEEEVGFDATDFIVKKKRPLEYFLNDTHVRLYFATNVPFEHKFEPKARKEIRKIAWFPVACLPKDKYDEQSCKPLGYIPSNFYTMLPAIGDIQKFIAKQLNNQNKPKVTILRKEPSAFKPVTPRSFQIDTTNNFPSPNQSLNRVVLDDDTDDETPSTSAKMFKPLSLDAQGAPLTELKHESIFAKIFNKNYKSTNSDDLNSLFDNSSNPPEARKEENTPKNIQQPKPIRPMFDSIHIVYECPDSPIIEIKQAIKPAKFKKEPRTSVFIPQGYMEPEFSTELSEDILCAPINNSNNFELEDAKETIKVEKETEIWKMEKRLKSLLNLDLSKAIPVEQLEEEILCNLKEPKIILQFNVDLVEEWQNFKLDLNAFKHIV